MEPRQNGPGGVEHGAGSAEMQHVEQAYHSGEQLSGGASERVGEKAQEIGAVQAEVAQIAMPALPAPVLVPADGAATGAATDDTQLAANDDDLIEKEWIDKAKKIIAETKDDPSRREREVSKLQIEYVRKRYGRIIGDSGA